MGFYKVFRKGAGSWIAVWVRMWCGAWRGRCRGLAPGTEGSSLKSGWSSSLPQKAARALQREAQARLIPQPSRCPPCPGSPPAPFPASCARFPAHPAQKAICSHPGWQPVHPLCRDAAARPGCDREGCWEAKRGVQRTANPSPTATQRQRQRYFGKRNRWLGYCFQ